MKGRQKGRPTKWVSANITEEITIGKPGVTFEIWEKWKRTKRKLGTLTVSVGGLRWWPSNATKARRLTWDQFAEFFDS